MVTGMPLLVRAQGGFRKPKTDRVGADFAGTVEAVGRDVTQFKPGDEVFGGRTGALAEYVCVREERAIVPKPANLTFEQVAAVPIAALTALQGLRDKGHLQSGQKVLINGASGGVGTFAVQIAKALGAEVTGVCSTRNVDTARSIGADHVIDYTQEDFTRSDRPFDLMIDIAGSKSWSECKRVLTPEATLVIVGAHARKGNSFSAGMGHIALVRLASIRGTRTAVFFIARFNKPDMETLRDLLETGKVSPVIDRQYSLSEVPEALAYLGEGHARGKVVITV